ncbi:23S rRNA (guanosine(2251)-2'-O)-methyltransferase RlmB [Treponema rectale]|uniref:23S rRNA (Guanosine(2251)-2'-O)-methyltransferase RlmB n=1 Tax=Treponema rectale TaxID=744512 RepID=A0A840SEE2_9SPIR|nr:23S rRNA (guanosine(2251)-2'-O)-methyltransferase RlmB [Treponema rectale]MBB5219254.1 23S rRNA (guanosine2251-2'-O)-methyltransferase [Treponema rectale]QOS40861.1 23S rRNA (guanosine(2251)-2'-O)-methyltransferase RlmB [Treponema rectale]
MSKNIYTGFHAVEERVRRYASEKTHSSVLQVFYSKPGPRVKKILSLAKEAGIQVEESDQKVLDAMVAGLPEREKDHRGIVLTAEGEKERASNSVRLDQWISECPEKATVIVLDSVTDPHNIGAILRSCDQFGADLLVTGERNSTSNIQENDIIARTSAGASAWVPLAVETNLNRAVELLKEHGFWVYGADAGGTSLQSIEFAPKTCIVMGSEGTGISRLLTENCDSIVSIPTCGKIDSLNVSVAAGVLLYERHRQSL